MHGTKKIHSDMIFLMVAVLSAYNIDNKIALAQVSIETHGSIIVGQSIVLECKVTSFGGGGASWSQDNGNTILTLCNTGGVCTDPGTGNYLYKSNSNGINVTISLTSSELGKTWTCTHDTFKASKTVSSSPTETTKMVSTSTNIYKTSSSQNPSTDTFHTQKTEKHILTTTYKGLTSASLYVTSEVTTPLKTESNNAKKLTSGEIKVIAISISSGILFFVLIGFLVICRWRHHRRNHLRKHTSEQFQQKQRKTNETNNHELPEFKRNFSGNRYGMKENSGSSTRVKHDFNHHFRKYGRGLSNPSMSYPSGYDKFLYFQQNHTMNRNEHYGIHTPFSKAANDNNQHMRGYKWGQPLQSPKRLDNLECYFTRNKNNYIRREAPDMQYAHVNHDLQGFFIYQGHNMAQGGQ